MSWTQSECIIHNGQLRNGTDLGITSTDKSIIEVHAASEQDIDTAVAAARAAFEGDWRGVAAVERGALLTRIANLIDRDRELLAAIDAYDNGKASPESEVVVEKRAADMDLQ